jgi:hypothetical protein
VGGTVKKTVVLTLFIALFLLASSFSWASKKPEPAKSGPQTVDAGSFGIYKSGRRIATETFHIEQTPDTNTTESEFKMEDGSSHQISELLLSSLGELRKYSWHEAKGGPAQATVTPTDQMLMEHMVDNDQKPHDVPFLLPPSTTILDDYFFVHRELLLWKYIASSCAIMADCKLSKASIGVINPHQADSYTVNLEYVGQEKVTIRGAEQQLRRFNLQIEGDIWSLWIDDQMKLIRIAMPGTDMEIVRD